MSYVSTKDIQKKYGVGPTTVRQWAIQGKLQFITTRGGQRRYRIDDGNTNGRNIIYARVSSRKQQGDLDRQSEFLRNEYPGYELVTDIGSGINFERQGFKKILEQLFDGEIKTVVVAHRERFVRFGFSFFEWLFLRFGGQLISHRKPKDEFDQRELHEDLMAIITVFSAKYHGRRKYKHASSVCSSGSDEIKSSDEES